MDRSDRQSNAYTSGIEAEMAKAMEAEIAAAAEARQKVKDDLEHLAHLIDAALAAVDENDAEMACRHLIVLTDEAQPVIDAISLLDDEDHDHHDIAEDECGGCQKGEHCGACPCCEASA
jgi:hypothetical protein